MDFPVLAIVERLCRPGNWFLAGASALVFDRDYVYLEFTKPSRWGATPDGRPVVGLGGIGGRPESGESPLECLRREAWEEIGVLLLVLDAESTWIMAEGKRHARRHSEGERPRPWFYTVDRNRQTANAAGYALIVTYLAEAMGQPTPVDLYGLVAVPRGRLAQVLAALPASPDEIVRRWGAELVLNDSLPAGALIEPVFAARSLALLPHQELDRWGF